MSSFHQQPYVVENLSIPVIVISAACVIRIWVLVVRYRGIKRLLKWQQILLKQNGKPPALLAATQGRTFASFLSNLMPTIFSSNYSFSLTFRSKLRQYHPLFGFSLDNAEGIRLTMLLWGQVLFVFLFGLLFIDALFHRVSSYNNCEERLDLKTCESTDSRSSIHGWMTLCEWDETISTCRHSFYFHEDNEKLKRQAMIIVVTLALCTTCASIACTQFILQHPLKCISIAYNIDFATTSEKPDINTHFSTTPEIPATTVSSRRPGDNVASTSMQPSIQDFNDELRGACGDKRPNLQPLPPTKRRLLKLTKENTILPLPLGQARQRIVLLAARHRQLREKYDDLPTGKILSSLLQCPPTVTPFPQRPMSHVTDTQHCWNALRTSGQVCLFQYHLKKSAYNPRALQALFETCRHYHTDTIYQKLRNAQDITQDLHYVCQHLPAPYTPEAKMLSLTTSLVRPQVPFDRDLYLMKTFCVLWVSGVQSMFLFQILLEEETEMLYYIDDALRATLAFERTWQQFILIPLLWCYRRCLRPDNAEITRQEATRAAFRTTRILYASLMTLLFLIVLPGGLLYYFYWMTDGRAHWQYKHSHTHLLNTHSTKMSVLFLWQCVCLVSLVQYYAIILPLRVFLLDILLPRIWVAQEFSELHRVISARLPYIMRRRTDIILDENNNSPNKPRFLPNQQEKIRENGSYLQAFHPVCRVCRHVDILRQFPIAHFFLALSDRDLTVPSHFRPILEIMQLKQMRNAPKHIELKRQENATTIIEDSLTRQSVLVYDALTMFYRDVKRVCTFLWTYLRYLVVTTLEIGLTKFFMLCGERQVRVCAFDLGIAMFVFGYLQLAVLAYALHFPRLWILGLIWVFAPLWGFWVIFVLLPKAYMMWQLFWNQGYEDMLPAQERAKIRHRALLRKVHEKESRMVGIDLLGDMPAVVDISEAEAAEEEYLKDKAKRLGKPLYEVRKKPKAFIYKKKKIEYKNKSHHAQTEKTLRWYRNWERGHLNRVLNIVGVSVFWFMPLSQEKVRLGRDLARVAVVTQEVAEDKEEEHETPLTKNYLDHSKAVAAMRNTNTNIHSFEEKGENKLDDYDANTRHIKAKKKHIPIMDGAVSMVDESEYQPPDYDGEFSDMDDDDSMA